MSIALCPVCKIELGVDKSCSQCSGVLTGISILKNVCPEGFLKQCFDKVKQHGDISSRECPSCSQKMKSIDVPGVFPRLDLDFCLTCLSIWFDANELKRLPQKTTEEKRQFIEKQMQADRESLDKHYEDQRQQRIEAAKTYSQMQLIVALAYINSH